MTSLRRFVKRSAAILPMAASLLAQQQPVQKPGVPGIQRPIAEIVPDAIYPINGSPDWLAVTEDSVWVNSKPTDMIFRMDPRSNKVLATVPVKKPCSGFAVAAGTLWSPSCEENVVYRIDLATNKVIAKVPVGPANTEGGIAFGAGSAWMPSDPKGIVSRIDPATNRVTAQIAVAPDSFTAVFAYGLVWVSSTAKNLVSLIQPETNSVIAEIPVDPNPRFMAAGEGYVWTLNQGPGTVSKIDPRTMRVVATIDVGVPGPGGDIAAGEGAVWVTQKTIPLSRIDPITNRVTAQFAGPGGDAMRIGHGFVWLSNGHEGNVWRFMPQKATPPGVSGLQPGVLPASWKTGGPNCLTVPDWQVHEYNEDLYVLRESGCVHYEKPFLYLIFGEQKALLEDTGAGKVDTAPFVAELLARWAKRKNHAPVSLVVIHSHGHGDHTAGDKGFQNTPGVQFIAATPAEIQKAADIAHWPDDIGHLDLGNRIIDIIPIPGHNDASIALYDRLTGNLFTGDSLYPGRLYVSEADLATYTASAKRLADFVEEHSIANVLGTHIEQASTPYLDYPRGTTYQPEEHPLALTRAHVLELNDAFVRMNGKLQKVALPDFTIAPRP